MRTLDRIQRKEAGGKVSREKWGHLWEKNGTQVRGGGEREREMKVAFSPYRIDLAESLGLSQLQVKTWYQNRRMKWKKIVSVLCGFCCCLNILYINKFSLRSIFTERTTGEGIQCFLELIERQGLGGVAS